MITSIVVEGIRYNMVCGVSREARIESSEVSGEMMDGHYVNDVEGTRFVYTVTLAIPVGQEDNYAALYEVLSTPQAQHTFVLPYNDSNISIQGRIENIRDTHVKTQGSQELWRATSFRVVSNVFNKVVS